MSKCASDRENLNVCPFPRQSNFTTSSFFHPASFFCFPSLLARFPNAVHEWAMQTSHQPHSSLPSLIMALIPSRWINIFIPSAFKARRLLQSWIQERETEREKETRSWRKGKGWQMEGWINVEMNQQQSNKAMARFSGSSHNTSDLFPPWHNYHSRSNYFPLLNSFLMTDCVFFNDRVCIARILECCCATLSPQTVSTDLHRKGGKGRRKWRQKGVGL